MKIYTSILFLITITIFTHNATSQGIQGIVKDVNSVPIPNVAIIVEVNKVDCNNADGHSNGTSANSDGVFKLNLQTGRYKIAFQALGYKPVSRDVVIDKEFENLDVVLEEQQFQLNEVVVNSNDEDPAYAIMRKAISLAPFHLNQIKKYNANVYLRGTLQFITIPWIFRNQLKVNDIPVKEGDIFSQESVNEIKFEAPDKCEQRVISIQSNIPKGADVPLPNIGDSFYQPTLSGCISPLSPKAFSFYRFVYEGFSSSNNFNICKIRVVPRHKSTELYEGYIYIVEDCWALQSLNLTIDNTFGTLNIKMISTPLVEDAWMPMTYNFKGEGSMMGVSGVIGFNGSLKYSTVELNTALIRPPLLKAFSTTDTAKTANPKPIFKNKKNEKFFNEIAKKEKLSNRDMIRLAKISEQESKPNSANSKQDLEIKDNRKVTVEKDAKLKDSTYWSSNRPIPLTLAESKAFKVDTTLQRKSLAKKDSVEKKPNAFQKSLSVIPFFGKSMKVGSDSSLTLGYNGLVDVSKFGYNTVDGLVLGQSFYANWQADSVHRLEIKPAVMYAFARKSVMWEVGSSYTYSPLKRGYLEVKIGNESSDFNQTTGIKSYINAAYTLLMRQNNMKLFDNKFATVSNRIDLANGLVCTAKLTYAQQKTLDNNTSYSFFYKNSREFSSNTPDNSSYLQLGNAYNRDFVANVELSYTPNQFYRIDKGVKRAIYSNYPTFSVNYKKGIPDVFISNSDFNFLEGSIYHRVALAGSNAFTYSVAGGGFLSKKSLYFTNFRHFNTQNLVVNTGNFDNTFSLLDYYKYSSNNYFVGGRIQYTTPYLLLKLIPIFSKQFWTENLYVKYLTNERIKNYCETGYSLNQVYFICNLGVFAGFENGKYKNMGFRLGLAF